MYIIRKYIKADSVQAALRKDKSTPPHDVWIDEEWRKKELPSAIGFTVDNHDDDE